MLAAGIAPPFFVEIAAIVAASALIAYVCHRLGIVPIVGFLIAGVVIGPRALGIVYELELVNAAAEVGVLLLLFTIGIEFSLAKLAKIQRLIFAGGGLQVGLATLVTVGMLLPFGVSWQAALFTGFLVALSSTAIVLKLLGDSGEMDEPHGQVALGLLIFQDLAIILMVLLVPMLAGAGGGATGILWALTKAGLIIAMVLLFARRVMPPFLEAVARTCSPELFLLTVIGVCFGTAYLTSLAGVSLSLGAFLAGLLVSETRFSDHAMGEIMPLQILFSATFFVSVGMLLDLGFLVSNLPLVLAVVILVIVIKAVTTGISARVLGYSIPVSAASALMLAQIGEFSFVLERTGREAGLFPAGMEGIGSQTFIAATVLVMILTPSLSAVGARVRRKLQEGIEEPKELIDELVAIPKLDNHVIVAGFGSSARRLVRAFQQADIPFVVLTLSPDGANEAEAAGITVIRANYSRQHVLEHAGIERATTLIVADDEIGMAHRVVSVARTLSESLHIVVRTRQVAQIEPLHEIGVDCVIADELESIVQLFGQVLHDRGVAPETIHARAEEIRAADYATILGGGGARAVLEAGRLDFADATVTLGPVVDSCGHLPGTRAVTPASAGCAGCMKQGDTWVHLRVCMTCGEVGCCDSSKNRHATGHYHETGHPVMRSVEPGETWGWCYAHEKLLR